MRRRHAISPGFPGHYQDLGISSTKRHDSACNLILSVVTRHFNPHAWPQAHSAAKSPVRAMTRTEADELLMRGKGVKPGETWSLTCYGLSEWHEGQRMIPGPSNPHIGHDIAVLLILPLPPRPRSTAESG